MKMMYYAKMYIHVLIYIYTEGYTHNTRSIVLQYACVYRKTHLKQI